MGSSHSKSAKQPCGQKDDKGTRRRSVPNKQPNLSDHSDTVDVFQFHSQRRKQEHVMSPSSCDSGYGCSANNEMWGGASNSDERSSHSSFSLGKPNMASMGLTQIRMSRRQSLDLGYCQFPKAQPSPELKKPWRKFDWGQKKELKKSLERFSPCTPNVECIKILVAGQVGAGKSSFINSVNSAIQGEISYDALADATSGESHSFTQRLKTHRIRNTYKDLPFEMCDVMGLEPETLSGCHADDIIATIYGHVKDGYKFKHRNPLSHGDEHYKETPLMSDQAFCLVYIIDASTVQFTDERLIEKLRIIRHRVSDAGIPQVIVMTKVDEACPLVRDDLRKIYTSKKIKEKMELCSGNIGVPMNSIFPVKNYHDEIDTDDDVDVLILKAFNQIVRSANARLRSTSN